MTTNLSLDVALASMDMIAEQGTSGMLEAMGISRDDFRKVTGRNAWSILDRQRMTSVLMSLIYLSTDRLGLPRFPLPAEYLSAGIAMFCSGPNVLPACIFLTPAVAVEALSRQSSGRESAQPIPVQPQQIFALVSMLYNSSGYNSVRSLFSKNTGIILESMKVENAKAS